MALTKDQVRHIAKLARLGLSEKEFEKFSLQLTDILQYVEILNEVDTEGVEPTSQVTGLQNILRPDTVTAWVSREELLACTELPVEQNQIRVRSIIS